MLLEHRCHCKSRLSSSYPLCCSCSSSVILQSISSTGSDISTLGCDSCSGSRPAKLRWWSFCSHASDVQPLDVFWHTVCSSSRHWKTVTVASRRVCGFSSDLRPRSRQRISGECAHSQAPALQVDVVVPSINAGRITFFWLYLASIACGRPCL